LHAVSMSVNDGTNQRHVPALRMYICFSCAASLIPSRPSSSSEIHNPMTNYASLHVPVHK
jgi:hypothetical protein